MDWCPHSGGVSDSHLLSTMETRDKHWPYSPSWLREGSLCCINVQEHVCNAFQNSLNLFQLFYQKL